MLPRGTITCAPPPSLVGRAAPPGPARRAAVAMAEQLRKIQHDAYVNVMKTYAVTGFEHQQLTFMARGLRVARDLLLAVLRAG